MALNALELEFSYGLGSPFSLQGADMVDTPRPKGTRILSSTSRLAR